MNKSPLTSILTGALGLSALVSLILCYLYISTTREARTIQGQVMNATLKRNVVNGLAGEALEYSKKNPAITPLLQSVGVTPQNNAGTGGKPTTR